MYRREVQLVATHDGSRARGRGDQAEGGENAGRDERLGVRRGSDVTGPRGRRESVALRGENSQRRHGQAMRAADRGKGKRSRSAGTLFKDRCCTPPRGPASFSLALCAQVTAFGATR